MRHIVYLLLVANVVYLGWNLFQGRAMEAELSALPPLPEGVRTLVTLQEHAGEQAVPLDASGLDALTAAQPPGAIASRACKALGPFPRRAEVEEIAGRLGEMGLDPVLRSVESRAENGFWVYLPAMAREQSREVVRQLKAHNDKDYYVGKDYFISLGTFKDIERAEIRLAEVQEMGFEARLEPRYRTREEYWLELPDSAAAGSALEAISTENPQLQTHALSCL